MGPDVKKGHIAIQNVSPQVDGGRRRAKAVVGDTVHVEADVFRDGPDVLGAVIRYKSAGDTRWNESPLTQGLNDRWSGHFQPAAVGVCRYTIEAWTDRFATWRRDLSKKVEAGQDVRVELEEGAILLESRHLANCTPLLFERAGAGWRARCVADTGGASDNVS